MSVWYGAVWCSVVWCGVVWYGMVRYGMVWYGILYYSNHMHYSIGAAGSEGGGDSVDRAAR